MPTFEYQARRASGEVIRGTDQADSRAGLKTELAGRGLLLIDARPMRVPLMQSLRPARVKPAALLGFLREFRHMIEAGLTVSQSLAILKDRPGNPVLGAAVTGLRDGVEKGLPLDEAAARHASVFDATFRAALAAGVRTSQMGQALRRLESFLALRADIARKVRKAAAYPMFLLALLVVVLGVLVLFVLPRFADLYAEFGSELPAATAFLMSFVRTAPAWVPVGLSAIILATLAWRRAWSRPGSRKVIDAALLRLPALGPVLRDVQLVQASYMLSMLLKAGTPLKDALDFAAASATNAVMRARMEAVAAGVQAGRSFSAEAAAQALYPPVSLSMLRAGEMSGALPDLMEAVGAVHEQDLEERMARLLALIEPAIMLLVGIVLGAVIIVVYLPVFGISGVVN